MRLLGILLMALILVLGALSPQPASATAEKAEDAEIHAPSVPLSDQPLRILRLEPPERNTHQELSQIVDSRPPGQAAQGTMSMASGTRPWPATLALHIAICVFLC